MTNARSSMSRRYLALWFPFLPADRLRRRRRISSGVQADAPLVFVEKIRGGLRLAALDPTALGLGLRRGLTLADARARVPHIEVVDLDTVADAALLEQLADDGERWTPLLTIDPPDGMLLDITGCAHVFGGEATLRRRVLSRLARAGLTAHASIAGTPDAARALVRFGGGKVDIVPEGKDTDAVAPLPIAALNMPAETLIGLSRAGLKTIGDLASRPSQPLVARFGEELLTALRRVLGIEDVRITPRRPFASCIVERRFMEPIAMADDIERTIQGLIADAVETLEARGEGGRVFEASFFRADGAVRRISVQTGRPSRNVASVLRLYREKLDSLADPIDPGFGFDLIRLGVPVTEAMETVQTSLDGRDAEDGDVLDLVDRLVARFGRDRVLRFVAQDSHDPSRAAKMAAASSFGANSFASKSVATSSMAVSMDSMPRRSGGASQALAWPALSWPVPEPFEPPSRPLQLFDPPQPIETIAEVPDGPPIRFRWRRLMHHVVRAEGPERIASEWWRGDGRLTRDYYRLEDAEGRRFWIFRAGLYSRETDAPRWYLHGLFA